MRVHGNVTTQTAQGISDIKKLLVSQLGPKYNDTGMVIGYCVSCTIQSLNDHYAAQAKELQETKGEMNAEVQVESGTPTDVQDTPVSGSGPDVEG